MFYFCDWNIRYRDTFLFIYPLDHSDVDTGDCYFRNLIKQFSILLLTKNYSTYILLLKAITKQVSILVLTNNYSTYILL